MKILHIVWGMQIGGIETMLVNIINEQLNSEDVALFIINDFINSQIINKLSSRCLVKKLNRNAGSRNPLKIIKLNKWIWEYKPDVVHVHSYRLSNLVWGRWNIVRTIHNTRNLTSEYNRMKALYAISESVRAYTNKQGFNNVKTIENGIKVSEFKKKTREKGLIFKIVQIGRLFIEQKGQDILLRAVDVLVNKRGVRGVVVTFIGCGPSEGELRQMCVEWKLDAYVEFLGTKSQDYIKEHLCNYDLFVQPSRYEGFGLTVAEAMASKVPVLVSGVEGPMEIVNYGQCGLTFESENVEELADKIELVMKGKYPFDYVEKAYNRVCEMYDVSVTAKRYIEEYKKIL